MQHHNNNNNNKKGKKGRDAIQILKLNEFETSNLIIIISSRC